MHPESDRATRQLTGDSVREALSRVAYPGLTRDLVSFGMVEDVSVREGQVTVRLGVHTRNDDVRAALDWLDRRYHLPIVFAGFSFGASVGLQACCPDARVPALIALGTPVEVEGRAYEYNFLQACAKPKLFVSGDQDPFGPRSILEGVVERAAAPKKLVFVAGAGHFFEKNLAELRHAIQDWVQQTLQPRSRGSQL